MQPLSFIIVGSGWRAMFYVRIALRYPQCFKLRYLLCRTEEKTERIRSEYGIPVTTDVQTCEEALSRTWKPEVHMEMEQDEYAIATMMLDMHAFIEGKREVYPLAESLEDAYIWFLMNRALKDPGEIITSGSRPWQNG